MKCIITVCCALFFTTVCFSQTLLQEKRFTSVTKDNAENNYGAYASVTIDYMVRSSGKDEVYISTSVSNFTVNSSQGYGYKGKLYRNEVPGLVQALDGARASSPTVVFKIYYAGNIVATKTASVTAVNNLNAVSGDGFAIPATQDQIKNPNWTLEAVELKSFSLNPDESTYNTIIADYLKMLSDKDAYKKQIAIADRALNSASTVEELSAARAEYNKAASIAPKESYPGQKIQTINRRIGDVKKEEEEKKKSEQERLKKEEEERLKKEEEEKNQTEEEKLKKEEEAKKKSEEEKKKEVEKKKEPEVKTKEQIKEETLKEIERLKVEAMMAEMRRKQAAAAGLEAEGDKFFAMGTLFMKAALDKYNAAQENYYTYSVEQKIKKIKDRAAIGLAVEKAGEKIDDAVYDLDPNYRTRFFAPFISYEGLLGDYKKMQTSDTQDPYSVQMGVTAHRLFLTIELNMGYSQSPRFEYEVEKSRRGESSTAIVDKIIVQGQYIGLGGAVGLNIPISSLLNIYGIFGADMTALVVGKSIKSTGPYELDDSPFFPFLKFRKSVGIDFRIPKTSIGLGVRYNLNSFKGENGMSKLINTQDPDDANNYYLGNTTDKKYKFDNLTVRFLFNMY